MSGEIIINFCNLTKRFTSVVAVKDAALSIRAGEVHAIVGGNGAGKSTLMKMIAGVYPDSSFDGSIICEGSLCSFKNVTEAQKAGIFMIPQELNMVNDLTIAENLFLDNYPARHGIIDRRIMYGESEKILENFGLSLRASTLVREIGIAQRQLITIARAMRNDVKVLLLDEPTATLSDNECKILFEKIRKLKKKNIALIYISHRMEEVKMISDIITVMRDGQIIETGKNENMDEKKIVSLMVGKEAGSMYPPRERTPGEVILSVKTVTVYDPKVPGKKIVDNAAFDLKKGEILSFYGLVGAGRSETALAMIGAFGGTVDILMEKNHKPVKILSPSEAIDKKIGYLPEDRKRQGVIDILGVDKNISVASLYQLASKGIVNKKRENETVARIIKALAIKTPSTQTKINNLSGGNAQKCVLGRWIAADSDILILDEATQGIDVEAKSQIYSIMDGLAKQGKSILFISSDLSEVMGVSDRILTMRHGKVVNISDGKKAVREQIIWEAAIGEKEEALHDN
ncbi:MAG: sugar ABC transporter ATP-binding protein [Treponema sp.]|jgi:D-xylose transport system ATP-binding protein|nr:sugar ABC transporter ATP-binding protein [Treponema sp.]